MNWNEACNVLTANLQAQLSGLKTAAMLWGPPGVGKSDMVLEVARRLSQTLPYDLPVEEIRLSTLSNVDVRGLPYRDGDVVRFSKPFFVREEPALYFFDEVNTAPPSNQVVAYEIALNHRIGGHKLAPGSVVVMAGNRATDRGATYSMPVPLRNRMQHIGVEPDVDTTFKYGLEKGWDSSILAFLKFKPSLLFQPPSGDQEAFPTPRSWSFVNGILPYDDSLPSLAGFIGEGAASEFLAFRRLTTELPDLDATLDRCLPFKSERLDVMYAYVVGLSQRLLARKASKALLTSYSKLIAHLAPDHPELVPVAILALRDTPHNGVAVTVPEFRELFKLVNGTVAV
jgi:MoxR-like ATPase